MTWWRTAGLGVALAMSIAGSARAQPGAAPLCRFEGEVSARLRGRSGEALVHAYRVRARGELVRVGGALRVEVAVDHGGWHVRGWADPGERTGAGAVLRLGEALWFADGIGMAPGADLIVRDAREGEVLVSPAAPWPGDSVRYVRQVDRWVPCGAVRLARSTYPSPDERRRAMGMTAPTVPVEAGIARASGIADTPGGEAFAEIGPVASVMLHVLEDRGEHRRVIAQVRGGIVVGWVQRDALGAPRRSEMEALGALMGESPTAYDRCTSAGRVVVRAVRGDVSEEMGFVDPGTPYSRREAREDGSFRIEPIEQPVLRSPDGVTLVGVASGAQECERVSPPPRTGALMGPGLGAGVGRREVPTRTRTLVASVVDSDIDDLDAGTRCEVRLTHPEEGSGPCRATLRCGREDVYGDRRAAGTLACEVQPREGGGDPIVLGRDTATTAGDGTPAFTLDERARTISVLDDPTGALGTVRMHLRIE